MWLIRQGISLGGTINAVEDLDRWKIRSVHFNVRDDSGRGIVWRR